MGIDPTATPTLDATFAFTRTATSRVVVGRGVEPRIADLVGALAPDGVVVIHDRNVTPLGERIAAAVGARLRLPVVGGEDLKRLQMVGHLSQALSDGGATRRTVLVGVGGGTVTDLVGLVASLHLRGLPLVLCPTTTLAMGDAALGGKNGVDHAGLKNVIGTFRQPDAVLADVDWLATLLDVHYGEGLAEYVKQAAVLDAVGFARLEELADELRARDPLAVTEAVTHAVRTKMDVVVADEVEGDRRRWLNFGHTIGHALESAAGMSLRHGRAVALGMLAECRAASDRVPHDVAERIAALLGRLGLATAIPSHLRDGDRLWSLAQQDKKATSSSVPMVVPERIGTGIVVDLTRARLERALA
jgi:3-dehydroquinate synthase